MVGRAMNKFDAVFLPDIPALYAQYKPRASDPPVAWWHCSASDRLEHDSAEVMDAWHKARGFAEIGYHLFVRKDGSMQLGRDWGKDPDAQQWHNNGSLAFCLHGLRLEKFTDAQILTMKNLADALDAQKPFRWRGHREVAAKLCPVVDYKKILGLDAEGFRSRIKPEKPPLTWNSSVLRIFDRGASVVGLQEALNRRGAFLVVDGIFGRATDMAVRAFQAENNLEIDGLVGHKTWAKLL